MHHDHSLKADKGCTGPGLDQGTVKISDLTVAELEAYRCGGEPLPALADMIAMILEEQARNPRASGVSVGLHLELKIGGAPQLTDQEFGRLVAETIKSAGSGSAL